MSVASPQTQPALPAAPGGSRLIVGVDTHQLTHHAAVIDTDRRRVADREFPATQAGYRDLVEFATALGQVQAYAVESTGSYGAGLTRHLLVGSAQVYEVYEVARPERSTRAKVGKSDPLDAYSAAEQVLTGRVTARPKIKTGIVEALRAVKIPRDSAVKERTRLFSQIRDLATTAPAPIHDTLIGLSTRRRVSTAAAYRPDPTRLEDPLHATKHALRALARRVQALDTEIAEADTIIKALTNKAVPTLLEMPQIGPQSAARLVITAGQNIDRMRNEAAFAKLAGVAPLPASSGKTTRHRLNRGGDRQANSTLYLITIGRMKNHTETINYVQRRRTEGLSNPEIIRCIKRHLARSIYRALRTDLMTP